MSRGTLSACLVACAAACSQVHPQPASAVAPDDRPALVSDERDSHCGRLDMSANEVYRMPLAGPVDDPESRGYLENSPSEARRTAQAAGLEPLLVAMIREEKTVGAELTPALIALREELTVRLVAIDAQLSAAVFEVHCTKGQIDDVLAELDHRELARQSTLAAASVILGALSGIAAGAWSLADPDSPWSDIVGISGATLTAGVGALALYHPDLEVKLSHEHNLLEPIWRAEDPRHFYSTFLFRMLTLPDSSADGSPRATMVHAWVSQIEEANLPSPEIAERVLYGDGGIYSWPLVQVRQQNFAKLEETLQSIARDVELLERFVVRKVFMPTMTPPTR
jgi:hypothetical protein